MRWQLQAWKWICAAAAGLPLVLPAALAAEGPISGASGWRYEELGFRAGDLRLVNYMQPPGQAFDPGALPESTMPETDTVSTSTTAESPSPGTELAVPSGPVQTPDVAQYLNDSPTVQTVSVQQRSALAFDPHVRGFHVGQVYAQANGEYWLPVRPDLDSMLSRIDPSLIESITVVPGPYGLRFGSGFAFIDVQTVDTPRYDCFEAHSRLGVSWRGNGDQWHGRETVYGGSHDWGFIFGYGIKIGSDYQAGNDQRIPSSYDGQNFLGQLGYDLSDETRVELRLNRFEQTDTEFALQFFDLEIMETESYSASLIHENACDTGETRLDGWYNRTSYNATTELFGKNRVPFQITDRVASALNRSLHGPNNTGPGTVSFDGRSDGDLASMGARAVKTVGEEGCQMLRIGADLRYVEQHTREQFSVVDTDNLPGHSFGVETNQPRAEMTNPGLFAELELPTDCCFSTRIGARLDYVDTNALTTAGGDGLRANTNFPNAAADFAQSDVLFAFYLAEDMVLTDEVSVRLAVGHAQRAPSLIERYADGVFVSLFQSGFVRVIGDPTLDEERNWQLDFSATMENESFRGRVAAFQSWVDNYITYAVLPVADPTGAYLVQTVATGRATLTGAEASGELDLTRRLSAFGSVAYVVGHDEEIDQPLGGINPLEGRAGLRLEDPCDEPKWGLEAGARMVARQPRAAVYRVFGGGLTQIEEETPGFTTVYMRGYVNPLANLKFSGGIENMGDRAYFEHLNLRLPAQPLDGIAEARVLAPGITPYLSMEWTY